MLAAVLRNTGDQDLDVTDTIEVNDPGPDDAVLPPCADSDCPDEPPDPSDPDPPIPTKLSVLAAIGMVFPCLAAVWDWFREVAPTD